jgi:3'-5' exonuclease
MVNYSLHKTMFIDIETVSEHAHYESLSAQMQKLWQRKSAVVAKDSTDYEGTYTGNAGIYAEFGKIVCVCLGYFTDKELRQFRVKTFAGDDEVAILEGVFDVFKKFFLDQTFCLAGHNIKEFDVPYICRRAMIKEVALGEFMNNLQNAKPWDNPLIDTLHLWRFGDYKNYTSLELLATSLGIATPKDDISGSDVGRVYWHDKDTQRISLYCSKDVVTTAQVLLKMNRLPLIEAEAITFV